MRYKEKDQNPTEQEGNKPLQDAQVSKRTFEIMYFDI